MTLALRSRQSGFSLIVSLMMLVIIMILGISGSQMAINEERGARNDRDRQVAFQAAEAALKEAEFELLDVGSPPCTQAGGFGRMRAGTSTCFDERSRIGFVLGCSTAPNEGLCDFDAVTPAYLNPLVDFYADAQGGPSPRTTRYGQRTTHAYQTPTGSYPPRYIIELVPKNTALASCPDPTCPHMFRVTAMGFGANPNAQVVLQSIVSTPSL